VRTPCAISVSGDNTMQNATAIRHGERMGFGRGGENWDRQRAATDAARYFTIGSMVSIVPSAR
jgi:hypothetical protein